MSRHPKPFRYPHSVHGGSHPSRASYPTFLSIPETLAIHVKAALNGFQDAFRWNAVIRMIASDFEIRSNVFKSIVLNSISLLSVYAFDLVFQPLVRDQQKWLRRNVGWVYQTIWLLPVIGVSFYLNNSWCSAIAHRTYILHRGNYSATRPSITYTGLLKAIATSAYRFVMVFTSVALSFALRDVPYTGPIASFVFLCWLYAYYCFEFVWIAQGMPLSRRVRYIEERWAYSFAFGLPSAAVCSLGSSLANATLFALLFPAFIIMAMHARPVPIDPYNPLTPAANSGEEVIRHPSPFIPIRLPIFALVIWLNNWIVRALRLGGQSVGSRITINGIQSRHRLTVSDTVESVEEGVVEPTSRQSFRLARQKKD